MLGLDAHSVRGMKWSAMPLIEYAAEQKLDAVLLNGLQYFESLEDAHLTKVKAAAAKGLGGLWTWIQADVAARLKR